MVSGNWFLKTFHELSQQELYNILRLRHAVFVIEQQCLFEDVDGKDVHACHHLFLQQENQILAYARILGPGISYTGPSISRVCTSLLHRRKGAGKALMIRAVEETLRLYPNMAIIISAQYYLKKFYEDLGFQTTGDIYLEDGIEHIQMEFAPK
jgi:ElaA protein